MSGAEADGLAPERALREAFAAAVAAADPELAVVEALPPAAVDEHVLVIGAGKAAAAMARGVERAYAHVDRLEGLVITRYGHALPTDRIQVAEAAHPVPDSTGRAASERVLAMAQRAEATTRVICLLSGGGSALLSAPDGIEPADLAELTKALLWSGATIAEINVVRKHLSHVKGGRLALAVAPASLLTLIVSDVVGDDPSDIASGPTVADPSRYADALAVLERYGIDLPVARAALEAGARGDRPETPKPGDPRLAGTTTKIIASNQASLNAAATSLERAGYAAHVLSSTFAGESRELAEVQAAIALQVLEHGQPFRRPCAILSGGETTVTVRGTGRGGRNSEFGLALLQALPAGAEVWALAADSDGIDGSEANAGVLLSPALLVDRDRAAVERALADNDAYGYFAAHGGLFVTGPTRTNVNDIRILLLP